MSRPAAWPFLHLSNLLTYVSIAAGFAAIVLGARGERALAGACLALSAVADPLDGKFARLFSRSEVMQRFGVQIDSLADAVAFCAAPPLVAVLLLAGSTGAVSIPVFVAGLVHLLCGLTRLGFYNVHAEQSQDFVGVPTTLMGLIWVYVLWFPPSELLYATVLVVGGGLMVAPIPIRRPSAVVLGLVILLAVVGGGLHLSRST